MVNRRAFTLDELELQPGARIKALWQVDGNIMWWDATVDGAAQDERGGKGTDRVYSLKYATYGDYKEQLVRVSFLPGRMLRDVATGDENVWRYDGEAQDEGITLWEAGLELGDRIEVAWKAGGEEADDGAEEWWTATIVGETGDGSIEVIYHARDGYEQERSAVTFLPGGVLKDLSTGDECEWRPLEAASDDTPPSDGTDESLEEGGGGVAVAVSDQLLAVEPEPFEIQPQAIEHLGLAPGARIKVRWIALDDDDGPATITYKWCSAVLVGVAPENGELWDAATNGTLYSIRYDDDPDGEYDLPAEPLPVLFTSPTTLMQDLCQEPTTINNLMWLREGEPTPTTNAAAVAAKTTAAEAEPPLCWK